MDNFKIRSIFAMGPAPPGCRPPNTSLFMRLESHLLVMSRRIKDTTARIHGLRNAHLKVTIPAIRQTIKEKVIQAIKDQIQARELMAKYSLQLKTLQEAEIQKVTIHMHGIDKICQEKNNKLALLRVIVGKENDPIKIRFYQRDIYALVQEQEKAKGLRQRWRLRLEQMEAAKVKVPAPPISSKPVNANKMISTPKPKTETKSINKVVAENIKKDIPLRKPNSGSNSINIVVTENIRKNIPSPNPKTDAKSINNVLTKNIIKNVYTLKPKTGIEATHKIVTENVIKIISAPKPKTDTKCIAKTVLLKAKEKIGNRKKATIGCKRCAFLQRVNKNKKYLPEVCKVCLKWSHKVLQDSGEVVPNTSIPINNTTTPKSALMPTVDEVLNTNIESTIRVEIEPLTDCNMIQESVTQMDPPKPSIDIEPLDASMNDEIMSDVIKEEKTEIFDTKMEPIDFEEVISIQDRLKAIDDKNTALAHVRILQEYAMLNDNYRAIGLLSEVETALINPAKPEDFECSL